MRLCFVWIGLVTAGIVPVVADAADVFDLRIGYWEMIMQPPDQPTPQKSYRCLTPEELENLRFFISNDEDCTYQPGGKQTKTTHEVDSLCRAGDNTFTFHWLLEAKDSMNFTMTVSVVVDGKTHTAHGTSRWLQESCDVASIPIS